MGIFGVDWRLFLFDNLTTHYNSAGVSTLNKKSLLGFTSTSVGYDGYDWVIE